MTDKEIIELCAKAMGLVIEGDSNAGFLWVRDAKGNQRAFGPLTCGDDYEQMEAELMLNTEWYGYCVFVVHSTSAYSETREYASHNGDKRAAKRWAGCLVGAEIGRRMK